MSFAADIIRRCRQFILILRECTTSYTTSCLAPDEKSDTLCDALTRLVLGLHPLDGLQAVIRVDPAPRFVSLKNSNALQHLGISVEVGRVKNTNKNPVAERAVLELEELLRQEPGGGLVTELSLAIATAQLNSRLRSQGLSSRELCTQRNQFSNEQIPIYDLQHILAKQKARQANYPLSEAAKGGYRPEAPVPSLQVGDLVYVKSDRDKSYARDRYIIVSRIDGEWCFIKKFSGSQLRATSYKMKLAECYAVPNTLPPPSYHSVVPTLDDDECEEIAE